MVWLYCCRTSWVIALDDTWFSRELLMKVSTSCGKCFIDWDICLQWTGIWPLCLPSHLHRPDLYLKYHLLSILLHITVILNVHATSLVEGRLVETLFFLDEELPCVMFKSESVAKCTVLFFDALLLLPLILGALWGSCINVPASWTNWGLKIRCLDRVTRLCSQSRRNLTRMSLVMKTQKIYNC